MLKSTFTKKKLNSKFNLRMVELLIFGQETPTPKDKFFQNISRLLIRSWVNPIKLISLLNDKITLKFIDRVYLNLGHNIPKTVDQLMLK